MENKSSKKRFIITTLLLGFLQTLLWESVISPLCDKIFSFVTKIFSTIHSSYFNNLYSEISLGYQDQYSHFVYLAVCFIMLMFIIGLIYEILTDIGKTYHIAIHEKIVRHGIKQIEKLPTWFMIIETLLILITAYVVLFFSIGRNAYINNTISSSLANIEIVSPYISDLEYKTLKSEFHSMDSKEDYDNFCSHLKEVAENNHVVLKK